MLVIFKVQRIERADGGCVRVTELNKRSFLGWIFCGVGVIACSVSVFSLIAMWKENEKFHKEVLLPMKNLTQSPKRF